MKVLRIGAISSTGLMALAVAGASSLMLLGSGTARAVPANDDFANAVTIAAPETPDIVATADTTGATTQSGENLSFGNAACGAFSGAFNLGATVWYNWMSPGSTGTMRFDTWGSDFATTIAVYTGSAVNALTPVAGACNTGSIFGSSTGNPTYATLNYAANTTYRIQVGGDSSATGQMVLNMDPSALIIVSGSLDENVSDSFVSLREALLLSFGWTGGDGVNSGLGRALSANEAFKVIGTPGSTSFVGDAIRFLPGSFPAGAPATITLVGGLSLPYPGGYDTISGMGAGVIIDGNSDSFIQCVRLNGANHVEGLQVRRCSVGILAALGSLNRIGGSHPLQRNVIRENTGGSGIGILASVTYDIEIVNNFIGTDASGSAAAGNRVGVYLDTTSPYGLGDFTIAGNTISGNTSDGLYLYRSANGTIERNKIGTKADGTGDLGNGRYGILLENDSSNVVIGWQSNGNVIAGNGADGIQIRDSSGVQIKGNWVGADGYGGSFGNDLSGIAVFGASDDTIIGGPNPGEGNVVSGNGHRGLFLVGGVFSGGVVQGNQIGVDGLGIYVAGNGLEGIYLEGAPFTIGGTGPNDGNIISGNGSHGIIALSQGHVIQNNYIGVGSNLGGIANGGDGVLIGNYATDVFIGAETGQPGANVIAGNTGNGVQVDGFLTIGNQIRINNIFANGGLGIALTNGGNASQASPVISGYLGGLLWGYVPGCTGCTVDVYQAVDGEGQYYVGTTTTNAGTAWSLTGAAHFFGDFTAVATGPYTFIFTVYHSSEFSAPFAAPMNQDGDAFPDTTDPCPWNAEDYDAFEDGDGCPETDNDGDGICDPGQTSVGCTGADMGRYWWQAPLGAQADCRNVTEDFDAFHDDDGCPEPDNDYDTFQDFTDDCPGANTNVGADGVADTGDEPILYLTPYQAREDFDGVIDTDGCHDSPDDDYDGDGAGDETEVFVMRTDPVNPDTDADTVIDGSDNCPRWPNPTQTLPAWPVPAGDSDCDGFTNASEVTLGTDPVDQCPDNASDDAWPPDISKNGSVSVTDVLSLKPYFGQAVPPAPARFDIVPSGAVNITDIVEFKKYFGLGCT